MPQESQQRLWVNKKMQSNGHRQSAFAFLGGPAKAEGAVDLLPVDAECLRDAVASWVALGHAITIGRTADGGAIGVHLLANGEKSSRYFSTIAELEDFLTLVRDGAQAQLGQ